MGRLIQLIRSHSMDHDSDIYMGEGVLDRKIPLYLHGA
jgi:hypothetical protein